MDEPRIVRAELIELQDDLRDVRAGGKRVPVQFNPETLKLAYANQVQNQNNGASGAGAPNQSQGTAGRQFVGTGTTKLTLTLWFDVSAATDPPFLVDDVRRLSAEVLYFMKPRAPDGGNAAQRVPPGVRFAWGSFLFDGVVESVEETVEFFSPDGKALRASMGLSLMQQDILVPSFSGDGRVQRPGSRPLAAAQGGQPLQQMAGVGGPAPSGSGSGSGAFGASAGAGLGGGLGGTSGGWQQVALANGIENPRDIAPGTWIDTTARRPRIVTE